MPPITLTDKDGSSDTVNAARIAFVDRNYNGSSFVTFSDGSERLFREEPDEVERRIEAVKGNADPMPTHNHGRTVPAHRLGWRA